MSTYTDNAVPFGSRTETINSLTYVFENITIKRPSKIIERPNQIGEPNGWVSVSGFPTGTATAQIATSATARLVNGDKFEDDFGHGTETWVIVDTDDPFPMHDYWKQNVTIRLSPNPPA
jgi:hypothetical protein